MQTLYDDPISVWHNWLADIRDGVPIDSGHHIAEERPDDLAEAIRGFLANAWRYQQVTSLRTFSRDRLNDGQ